MEPLGALDGPGRDGGRGAGLGPGGLQEPLAQPTLRPAPFPSLPSSGVFKDAPRTSSCDPGRGPSTWLGRLTRVSRRKSQSGGFGQALVPARGKHYGVIPLPGFPAHQLLAAAPFL